MGNVDLSRFIAALLVMSYHAHYIGIPKSTAWAWVEYFFLLTGYFTMEHFARLDAPKPYGQTAVRYTLRKFSAYAPYILIAVVARYVIEAIQRLGTGGAQAFFQTFLPMPYELSLISASGISKTFLAPIWYLSAMFIVMPLFCWLLLKCRDSWPVWAMLIPLLYYGKFGVNVKRAPLNDMLRAFTGMTLGSALYLAVEPLRRASIGRVKRRALTALELLCFALSVYITAGRRYYLNLVLLTFFVQAGLAISGATATARIRGRWCSFLAKMSLPMYLFHWNFLMLLMPSDLNAGAKIALFYALTIATAALATVAVERGRGALRRRRGGDAR